MVLTGRKSAAVNTTNMANAKWTITELTFCVTFNKMRRVENGSTFKWYRGVMTKSQKVTCADDGKAKHTTRTTVTETATSKTVCVYTYIEEKTNCERSFEANCAGDGGLIYEDNYDHFTESDSGGALSTNQKRLIKSWANYDDPGDKQHSRDDLNAFSSNCIPVPDMGEIGTGKAIKS
mgnify:FL=1